MSLSTSSLKILFARVIKSVAGFVGVIIFSRELGASPLGTYYPFLALLGILAIPADMGLHSATEKRLSEGKDQSHYLATAILLQIPLIIIVSVVVILFNNQIALYLGEDLAVLLIITLAVSQAGQFFLVVLRGELRVAETALIEVVRPIGWLIFGYMFYVSGLGVESLVLGYLVGSLFMLIIGLAKISVSIGQPSIKHVKSLLNYSRFSVVSSIGSYFHSWLDIIILTSFVAMGISGTRAEIGAYENAWRVSVIALLISQSISVTIFPQFSRWDAEGTVEYIEEKIPTALLATQLVVIPAFAGSVILSKEILRILFGPEFVVAWVVLVILCGQKIFQSINLILRGSLQAIDYPRLSAYATITSIIVNLVFNIVLVWKFGIVGAAVATTLSFFVATLLHLHYVDRFLSINYPIKESIYSLVASIIMAIILHRMKSVTSISNFSELIAIILIVALIYFSILLVFDSTRNYIFDFLKNAVNDIV